MSQNVGSYLSFKQTIMQQDSTCCSCPHPSVLLFQVDAVDSGVVAAYGPGLSYGVAGEPCTFTIDTKNAGAG